MSHVSGSDSPTLGQVPSAEAGTRVDAAIAYALPDPEFAARLRAAIEGRGKTSRMVEVTPRDGPADADPVATSFVFVLSPASASAEGAAALESAARSVKRILPVCAGPIDMRSLPEALSEHQLIPARELLDAAFSPDGRDRHRGRGRHGTGLERRERARRHVCWPSRC